MNVIPLKALEKLRNAERIHHHLLIKLRALPRFEQDGIDFKNINILYTNLVSQLYNLCETGRYKKVFQGFCAQAEPIKPFGVQETIIVLQNLALAFESYYLFLGGIDVEQVEPQCSVACLDIAYGNAR